MTALWKRWLVHSMTLAAAAVSVGGCDTPAEDPPKPAPANQSTLNGVNGELLHVIKPGANHRIEFYQLQHGQNGVFESHPVGNTSLTEKITDAKSLAAVFQALQPGESIPPALLSADRYAADMLAAGKVLEFDPKDVIRMKDPAATLENTEIASQSAALTRGAPICSGDNFGDNWGANWFRSNFCNEGNFRHCFTNLFRMARYAKGTFKWTQMEGDFNSNPGRLETWHYGCSGFWCVPELIRDSSWPVEPRTVTWFTYTTGGGHGGRGTSSNCSHMHLGNGSQTDSYEININQPGLPVW